jgi:hypothetical protein
VIRYAYVNKAKGAGSLFYSALRNDISPPTQGFITHPAPAIMRLEHQCRAKYQIFIANNKFYRAIE